MKRRITYVHGPPLIDTLQELISLCEDADVIFYDMILPESTHKAYSEILSLLGNDANYVGSLGDVMPYEWQGDLPLELAWHFRSTGVVIETVGEVLPDESFEDDYAKLVIGGGIEDLIEDILRSPDRRYTIIDSFLSGKVDSIRHQKESLIKRVRAITNSSYREAKSIFVVTTSGHIEFMDRLANAFPGRECMEIEYGSNLSDHIDNINFMNALTNSKILRPYQELKKRQADLFVGSLLSAPNDDKPAKEFSSERVNEVMKKGFKDEAFGILYEMYQNSLYLTELNDVDLAKEIDRLLFELE